MKHVAVAALLIVMPATAFAADDATAGPLIVREFVHNSSVTDWYIGGGWTWSDGKLTHIPGASGAVEQRTMPTLTAGKTYRVDLTFSGRTRGEVTLSLGKTSIPRAGADGTYTFLPPVTDPDKLLALTATSDYDGVVSNIRVVELGDELVNANGWTVPDGWVQADGEFTHTHSALNLESLVGVVRGHTYRLYFGIEDTPRGSGDQTLGKVSVGESRPGWFYQQGNWNYAFDLVAAVDGRLDFMPPEQFKGTITRISVREITTDPVPSR